MGYDNIARISPFDLRMVGHIKVAKLSLSDRSILSYRGPASDLFFRFAEGSFSAAAMQIDDRTGFDVEVYDLDDKIIDRFVAQVDEVYRYRVTAQNFVELSFRYNRVALMDDDGAIIPTKIEPTVRSVMAYDKFIAIMIEGADEEAYRTAITKYRVMVHGGVRYYAKDLYKVSYPFMCPAGYLVIGTTMKIPPALDLRVFTDRALTCIQSMYASNTSALAVIQEVELNEHS